MDDAQRCAAEDLARGAARLEDGDWPAPFERYRFALNASLLLGAALLALRVSPPSVLFCALALAPFALPFLAVHLIFVAHVFACEFGLRRWHAALPLALLFVAVAIAVAVPFERVRREVDFRWHRAEREQVVALVRHGAERGDGDVVVLRTGASPVVLFVTDPGFLGHLGGFVYGDDGPACVADREGRRVGRVIDFGGGWHWVSV